jgi:peptide/nickel transport system permease protein
MLSYIIRRILATVPVMVVVALFVFSLLYIAPGDPAAIIAGDQATPDDVARIRMSLGLDRPFLIRFGEWFWQILHGDLGTSIFTNLPVATLIAQRAEPTLSLMAVTLILAVCVAVPIGVVAAWKADTLIDRAIMASRSRFLSWAICSPMCLRSSSIGCRCRATRNSPKARGRGCKT